MMNLLHKFHVEDVDKLKATKTTTYSSRKTAYELLETMADGVDAKINAEIAESPVMTILADETTDIATKNGMGIYARTVNKDMVPKKSSLTNLHIEYRTGATMTKEILIWHLMNKHPKVCIFR